jgi:hypothetical protein
MASDDTRIRIQASHIRRRLLSRNNSPYFRNTLAALADEQLVKMDAEHHTRKLQWVSEQGGTKKFDGRI